MQDWFSPHTLIPLFLALLAVAGTWGDLRARVAQQARESAEKRKEAREERTEMRGEIARLRHDVDELRTRNGSKGVMEALRRLEKRLDDADGRETGGYQRLAKLESQMAAAERQIERLRP